MSEPELSRSFVRFRERGDLQALGQVFDAAAPELLRVAVHLVGEPSTAEDLVQTTFLVAIERAETFDATRELRPWLIGILTHRARGVHRRARRAGTELSGDESPELRIVRGPADEAQERELEEALEQSVDRLPEELRSVVLLSLRHGLKPAEIAHALGRSPSTVRTQLQRGLEGLRERLPRGFTASGLVVAAPRGLEAVRAAVLEGAAAAPVVTSSVSLPLLVMNKTLLVAGGLAAALLVWWVGVRRPADPIAPLPETEAAPTLAAMSLPDAHAEPVEERSVIVAAIPARPPEAPREEEPAAQVAVEEESAPLAAPTEDDDPSEAWFDLRIVDPNGDPVEGAEVRVTGLVRTTEPVLVIHWGGKGPDAVSDVDGAVRFQSPRLRHEGGDTDALEFVVSHPDFVTHEEHLWSYSKSEGEIVLQPGGLLAISGWIGTPEQRITDVVAHISLTPSLGPDDWAPLRDGRPSTTRVPQGRHMIWLEHTAADGSRWFSEPTVLEMPEVGSHDAHLELVRGLSLSGELDPSVPRPVTGGVVGVNLVTGGFLSGLPRTNRKRYTEVASDGTFRFEDLPPGKGEIFARCDGWYSGEVSFSHPTVHDEDGKEHRFASNPRIELHDDLIGVEVPMEATSTMRFLVLGPDDRPVPGARVTVSSPKSWGGPDGGYVPFVAHTDAGGTATVEGIPAGWFHYGVHHEQWVFHSGDPDFPGYRKLDLGSGELADETVRLQEP